MSNTVILMSTQTATTAISTTTGQESPNIVPSIPASRIVTPTQQTTLMSSRIVRKG